MTQMLPCASHFMPSGTPGSSSERMPLANMRPGESEPSPFTSNAQIVHFTVSLT